MSQQAETADAGSDEAPAFVITSYRFENVEFQVQPARLLVAGQAVDVEPRPLQVLAELLQRVNEVVTREELLDAVWQGRPTVDHVLANAVSKLRGALGDAGAARIATVPRLGYRLAGPVQRVSALDRPQNLQAGQPVVGHEAFVLERALGLGSRSDVWLARHATLGEVQVFKFAPHGERLSALKREYTLYRVLRQELGPRDDIAVLVDANFSVSPCFLRCNYGGRSLPEWDDDTRSLAAMTLAERLALFIQIARPVAAAHGVGVLHKDIKPGNVLIDGEPGLWRVRLTDFGSGRLLDPSRLHALNVTALGLTQTQRVDSNSGTLMYLAPEVMAGQASSMQSDV
jgi:non-specific serine/threonine protein kinase